MRVVLTVLLLVVAAVGPAVGGPAGLPDAGDDGSPGGVSVGVSVGASSSDAAVRVVSADTGPIAQRAGTGDAATQTTNRTVPNASRVLAFPPAATRNSTIRTTEIDVGGATGIDAVLAGVRTETLAAEARVANATAAERPSAIRSEVQRLETAEAGLRERQRSVVTNYTTGEATPRETMVALARVHAVAGELQRRATRLAVLAENATVEDEIENDARRVALDLASLRGPVRASVLAAARGERPPIRAFLATTEMGVVFSTLDGETFVREAYLGRLWGDDETPQSAVESSDVVADSYPEIWAARNASGPGTGFGSTFQLTVEHAGGRLDAFVRNNERVAAARQRIPLAAFPPGPGVERTTSGIRVVLNRTYPGGPVRLTVTDPETGEPLDAQVALSVGTQAGELLGQTGSDGQFWTLSPGVGFTVTVDAGPGRIAQLSAVSPAQPVTVGNAIRSRLQPARLAAGSSEAVDGSVDAADADRTLATTDALDAPAPTETGLDDWVCARSVSPPRALPARAREQLFGRRS